MAKVSAQYRRFVRPSRQASSCSCSNIVFIGFSRLASFAQNIIVRWSVGFVWLMRNRVARWVVCQVAMDLSVGFVWPKRPAQYRGLFGQTASIVLFMFKHCFHYDFTIGFVCGSWLRLRKASLSVGFVWLMRDRAAPSGSSANWRWIHPSGSFGQNRRVAARPPRLFAHTENWPGASTRQQWRRAPGKGPKRSDMRQSQSPVELPCSWFVLRTT